MIDIILKFVIIIACVFSLFVVGKDILHQYREKRRVDNLARCKKCGMILSDWFVVRERKGIFMYCYGGCKTVSEWSGHEEYRKHLVVLQEE